MQAPSLPEVSLPELPVPGVPEVTVPDLPVDVPTSVPLPDAADVAEQVTIAVPVPQAPTLPSLP